MSLRAAGLAALAFALLLLLVQVDCACTADLSRLQMTFNQQGINAMENLTFPLIHEFLKSLPPVSVPPITQEIVLGVDLGYFRVQNISIGDIGFDDLQLTIKEGQGIEMNLQGLHVLINYTLVVHLALTETFIGHGNVSDTTVDLTFGVRAGPGGIPQVNVTDVSLVLGAFNPGLDGIIGWIEDLFNPLILDLINWVLPDQLAPAFDNAVAAAIANMNFSVVLDPYNATAINVSLAAQPQFTADRLIFDLDGGVVPANTMQPCLLTPQAKLPLLNQHDFEFYVDESVVQCALLAFRDSDVLPEAIAPLLAMLHLDDRFEIGLNFDGTPSAQFANASANMQLPMEVYIDRNASPVMGPAERFITVPMAFSSDFDFSLLPTWQVSMNLLSLVPSIQEPTVADDFPPSLRQEMETTNYVVLSSQLSNIINTSILPVVANYTRSPISILPSNITFILMAFVRSQTLSIDPDYIYFGANVYVPADSPYTRGADERVRHRPGELRPSATPAPHFADETFVPPFPVFGFAGEPPAAVGDANDE